MPYSRKQAERHLSKTEWALVAKTYRPDIADLSDTRLKSIEDRLRARRVRARDLKRGQKRTARGKDARTRTGNAATAALILAEALKRVDTERKKRRQAQQTPLKKGIARRKKTARKSGKKDARKNLVANAKRALRMKQRAMSAAEEQRPPSRTANRGMRPIDNPKPREIIDPRVGRMTQFVRDAQAKRDAR
jgi:hypothetical protein